MNGPLTDISDEIKSATKEELEEVAEILKQRRQERDQDAQYADHVSGPVRFVITADDFSDGQFVYVSNGFEERAGTVVRQLGCSNAWLVEIEGQEYVAHTKQQAWE